MDKPFLSPLHQACLNKECFWPSQYLSEVTAIKKATKCTSYKQNQPNIYTELNDSNSYKINRLSIQIHLLFYYIQFSIKKNQRRFKGNIAIKTCYENKRKKEHTIKSISILFQSPKSIGFNFNAL